MGQKLLFPDPRPLVERLGLEFFRSAPESPGVYLMRDGAEMVLYVGKAKNLRKRLNHYRVANPDRMARRHLKLLRAVSHIELQECADEPAALARESELLRSLRPRFNRAGTWPGLPRYLSWRVTETGLEIAVLPASEIDWQSYGPLGAGSIALRVSLVRLLWCAIHADRGLAGMPEGWFSGRLRKTATIPRARGSSDHLEDASPRLGSIFDGQVEQFIGWIRERTATQQHPFEIAVREADLEAIGEFAQALPRPR